MAAEGGNILRFTYTGADGQVIPREATHIFVRARVVRREAFRGHPNIVEVICDEDVEKIEEYAFCECRSLRRVIMRGVKIVEESAFQSCVALEEVECDKLEIIGNSAFFWCFGSLRSINLPSARIVGRKAFGYCTVLMDVKFGKKLERIEEKAFWACSNHIPLEPRTGLERITIPLKDGLFTEDGIFTECDNLSHVDLIEGELHETIAALHLEEWRNDMNEEIDSINQTLPDSYAGNSLVENEDDDDADPTWDNGEKAQAIRGWIRSVLRKIILYQDEHQRLLNEASTTLEVALPNDIVRNSVLPFLELPSYSFEVEDDEEEEDSDDDTQSSERSLGNEEEE